MYCGTQYTSSKELSCKQFYLVPQILRNFSCFKSNGNQVDCSLKYSCFPCTETDANCDDLDFLFSLMALVKVYSVLCKASADKERH